MTMKRMVLTLSVFVAGVVWVGCRSNGPYRTVIDMPPEQVVGVVGEELKLRLEPRPSRDFKFQWQTNDVDIPNESAHGDSLHLEKVTTNDAALYRCKIDSCGYDAETHYTVRVALYVVTPPPPRHAENILSVHTPVSGPFQPTQPNLPSGCKFPYTNHVRFIWPAPAYPFYTVWCTPPPGKTTCTVIDTSQRGQA